MALTLVALLFSACGSSSSDTKNNDGKGAIDLRDYYPSAKVDHKIFLTEINGTDQPSEYQQIKVDGDTITTTIDNKVVEKILFSDTNITITDFENNTTDRLYRHVDLGDTLFHKVIDDKQSDVLATITTALDVNCKLKSKEKEFETYDGDLLKIECVSKGTIIYDINSSSTLYSVLKDLNGSYEYYDTSYTYVKKDLGVVAEINNDCIVSDKFPLIDDRKKDSECVEKSSMYKRYHN